MITAGTPLRLLFIEDSEDDAELALRNLSNEGFAIESRRLDNGNALQALLSDLSQWRPDVILSDYSMPGFTGDAALRLCQQLAPEIPFIFLSGTIGEELAIESIHNGATDYVLKENMRRLSTSIRRAIGDAHKRQAARAVEKERSRLIAILEATSDFVVIANPDGCLSYMNPGARKLLGRTAPLDALNLGLLHPQDQWDFIRNEVLASRGGLWHGDVLLQAEDGAQIPVSLVVIQHREPDGGTEYFSFLARDIRERRAYEKQIQYLANFDSLTELPNRTLLADRVTQAINQAHWTNRSLALLIIDIDRFKLVNDGYGHDVGDALLKQFGNRLRNIVRNRDTIARVGGNCFAVLATELSKPEDVMLLVSKLQSQLSTPYVLFSRTVSVTTGIGISVYPRDSHDFATLLQHADIAMHRVKEKGDGGFQFYATEMTRIAAERVRIETELRQAIAGRQLELYYQLQVGMQKENVVGVEALMRWNHPEHGLLTPDRFIPIAENSDIIYSLGEWALRTACQQLVEWDRQGAPRLRMAVNVSARQFRAPDFSDMVARVLNAVQLDPRRLELELTESVLVSDQEEAALILQRLNALGVQVALDDFGTGYSNLNYLSRLPIHTLKIDRSFVQRAPVDGNDAEIVRAIITLAAAMGLRVVAEGIETQRQLDLLRRYNCAEGQGYFFARPLPASVLAPLIGLGAYQRLPATDAFFSKEKK